MPLTNHLVDSFESLVAVLNGHCDNLTVLEIVLSLLGGRSGGGFEEPRETSNKNRGWVLENGTEFAETGHVEVDLG